MEHASSLATRFDTSWVREMLIHTNDGVIAGAGIIEGLDLAGASHHFVVAAGLIALLAGAIGIGSVVYLEMTGLRDTTREALAEEKRRHALAPDEELAELTEIYVNRGLNPELARHVAEELSSIDPVSAHARDELGLTGIVEDMHPARSAFQAGGAFALGAFLPALAALLAPDEWTPVVTLITVGVALTITSILSATSSHLRPGRTILRTVGIGAGALIVTSLLGSLVKFF